MVESYEESRWCAKCQAVKVVRIEIRRIDSFADGETIEICKSCGTLLSRYRVKPKENC